MHKISNKFALLITNSTTMDDIAELVSYSVEAILSTCITAFTAFLLSYYFNCFYEFFIFNICFIPIRLRHKGFHFKKFMHCFLCSNFMIILCCVILKYSFYNHIFTISFYLLIVLHYHFSLEKNLLESVIIAIFFTLSLFINSKFSLAIYLGIFTNLILITGRNFNEKIINYD